MVLWWRLPHLSPDSFVSDQIVPGFLYTLHTILDYGCPCFTVGWHAFLGVGANICQLHVLLAEIFELEVCLPTWVSALTQFTLQYVLSDLTRIYLTDMG